MFLFLSLDGFLSNLQKDNFFLHPECWWYAKARLRCTVPFGKRLLLKSLPDPGCHRRLYLEGWEGNMRGTWSKTVSISKLPQVNSFTSLAVVFISLVNRVWLQYDNKTVGLNLSSCLAVWVINCQRPCQPFCFIPVWSTIAMFNSIIAMFNTTIAMFNLPLQGPLLCWKRKITNLASCSCRDLQRKDLVNYLGSGSTPDHSATVLCILENRILLSMFYPGHQETDSAGSCSCCPG